MKLEQLLMMQTYQLQQDKRRLSGDAKRANCESDRLRQEVCMLRSRLEETEWNLCQKTGEISLLKTQLKDSQVRCGKTILKVLATCTFFLERAHSERSRAAASQKRLPRAQRRVGVQSLRNAKAAGG